MWFYSSIHNPDSAYSHGAFVNLGYKPCIDIRMGILKERYKLNNLILIGFSLLFLINN